MTCFNWNVPLLRRRRASLPGLVVTPPLDCNGAYQQRRLGQRWRSVESGVRQFTTSVARPNAADNHCG